MNSNYENLMFNKTNNAIILASGFGMRMVPINTEIPKALVEIDGEKLIERLIKQLCEANVKEIYVIVGFMQEQFEYLVDKYGVKLISNEQFNIKNNLHSLFLASSYINNTYIIPCDIWCRKNPFRQDETSSWYMISDAVTADTDVFFDSDSNCLLKKRSDIGNRMIGISYIGNDLNQKIISLLNQYSQKEKYNDSFWEEILYEDNKMIIPARVVKDSDYKEINTYEQLRELDSESDQLKSEAISIISKTLKVKPEEIINIEVLKKGMTNRSFLFTCNNKRYIMRIPGEGTEQLIDRRQECDVYNLIRSKNLCDDIIYINPENGYKITRFFENVRVCNSQDDNDVRACMKVLRRFHGMNLKVNHKFDIFNQIEYYESLREYKKSVYEDYEIVKNEVYKLRNYIEEHVQNISLTHIDAIPDNFLVVNDNEIRLIDWEYAGMQDPHVDIAMFCIYSYYDKKQIDKTIDFYFDYDCADEIRIKIYCYIAVCGLLWSNWCEYKHALGVDFGDYALKQYQYAKEYVDIIKKMMGKE